MKKYPLGHAIIEWKDGGHSQALFYLDREGKQFFVCANWISGPASVEAWRDQFENVISGYDDIFTFLDYQAEF